MSASDVGTKKSQFKCDGDAVLASNELPRAAQPLKCDTLEWNVEPSWIKRSTHARIRAWSYGIARTDSYEYFDESSKFHIVEAPKSQKVTGKVRVVGTYDKNHADVEVKIFHASFRDLNPWFECSDYYVGQEIRFVRSGLYGTIVSIGDKYIQVNDYECGGTYRNYNACSVEPAGLYKHVPSFKYLYKGLEFDNNLRRAVIDSVSNITDTSATMHYYELAEPSIKKYRIFTFDSTTEPIIIMALNLDYGDKCHYKNIKLGNIIRLTLPAINEETRVFVGVRSFDVTVEEIDTIACTLVCDTCITNKCKLTVDSKSNPTEFPSKVVLKFDQVHSNDNPKDNLMWAGDLILRHDWDKNSNGSFMNYDDREFVVIDPKKIAIRSRNVTEGNPKCVTENVTESFTESVTEGVTEGDTESDASIGSVAYLERIASDASCGNLTSEYMREASYKAVLGQFKRAVEYSVSNGQYDTTLRNMTPKIATEFTEYFKALGYTVTQTVHNYDPKSSITLNISWG